MARRPDDEEARAIAEALRDKEAVEDKRFDALYPEDVRRASEGHFTPVDVALQVAKLLGGMDARVLDVGAGAGKLCVIGALATGAVFEGIEQRRRFADAGNELAQRLGATSAKVIHGDIRSVDWSRYDGVYLFNPFGEHALPATERIDEEPEHRLSRLDADLAFTLEQLSRMAAGTRVVVYNGFGADLPRGYECLTSTLVHGMALEVWEK